MKVYNGPVWASHNNCRKFVNHNRQYSDEQINELMNAAEQKDVDEAMSDDEDDDD